jgi:XTP/dITP diphosphohydrolase
VKLVFASRNLGKVAEVQAVLSKVGVEVLSLDQVNVPVDFDVEEVGETFAQIAELKATEYAKKTGLLTLADDSGLSINALSGQPGVHSKRFFAGSDRDRNQHVLQLLERSQDRSAFFTCVMCLCDPQQKKSWCFEGKVEGVIAQKEQGTAGFGYDPIFIPTGRIQTFAQLGSEIKNTLSHRALALAKCSAFLAQHTQESL